MYPKGKPLQPGELRVFYTRTETLADAAVWAGCRALLSPEERERHLRFHFEIDQHSFLAAHALTRSVLADLLDVEPTALRFEESERGRPELCWPDKRPRVRFNLSHTHGLSALAVTLEADAGVDVEYLDRRVDIDQLATSVFSDAEQRALYALPTERRRERFFELWTLKESYIKAVGKGLALPLAQITLDLESAAPRIVFGPRIADDAARWSFVLQPLPGGHMLAAAIADPRPSASFVREMSPRSLYGTSAQ